MPTVKAPAPVTASAATRHEEYGSIGMAFALMTDLIAIGVVIILGAMVGLVWQERGLSFAAAFRKLRRAS